MAAWELPMIADSANYLVAARDVLAQAIERREVPGAVGLVRHRGRTVLHAAFGVAAWQPVPRPMLLDTVFDLASLTKPLATTAVVLALVDRGLLSLDDPVARYCAEFGDRAKRAISARRLLSHTSGLPGWAPTYAWGCTKHDVLKAIAGLELAYCPGSRVDYSCLGFIVLGLLAERVTGRPLDVLAEELVFEPLGLTATGYLPRFPTECYATTERGNACERAMVERGGVAFEGWRTDFYPGQVNDGNAFYTLGGVSGNAGLFGSAGDLGILGQMWLDRGRYLDTRVLSAPGVELAVSDQTQGLGVARGLGWQLSRTGAPTTDELAAAASNAVFFPPEAYEERWAPRPCGELLSPRAFGHTGFTGTSLWIDPAAELVVILLTNSAHPSVVWGGIASLRARFHNAVAAGIAAAAGPEGVGDP